MNRSTHAQIQEAEDRLRSAILASDIPTLEALLAPGLLYTDHLGDLQTRHDEIQPHRSGTLQVLHLACSEQNIRLNEASAVVSVRMHFRYLYDQQLTSLDLRFTRVWVLSPSGLWQVLAAHSTLLAGREPDPSHAT